jgi:hypothetical protein
VLKGKIILRTDFVLTLGDIRLTTSTIVLDGLVAKKAGASTGNRKTDVQGGCESRQSALILLTLFKDFTKGNLRD